MIKRDTELQITSEPAIAYSTCYRLPFLSLFHADCMEIMKQYPDKYFDLAIVDPPYELNGWHDKGNNRNRQSAKEGSKRKLWDKMPDEIYFTELKRISKNQIIWGGNYFLDYLGKCVAPIIWDKVNGTTHFADGEMAWTSFDTGTLRIFKKHLGSTELNKERMHPKQKPICLYSWILKKFAKEGMKLLDTHFGSGSIALAVDKANRLDKMNLHLTACEIDKEYIDKAIKRISESIKQGTLSF